MIDGCGVKPGSPARWENTVIQELVNSNSFLKIPMVCNNPRECFTELK